MSAATRRRTRAPIVVILGAAYQRRRRPQRIREPRRHPGELGAGHDQRVGREQEGGQHQGGHRAETGLPQPGQRVTLGVGRGEHQQRRHGHLGVHDVPDPQENPHQQRQRQHRGDGHRRRRRDHGKHADRDEEPGDDAHQARHGQGERAERVIPQDQQGHERGVDRRRGGPEPQSDLPRHGRDDDDAGDLRKLRPENRPPRHRADPVQASGEACACHAAKGIRRRRSPPACTSRTRQARAHCRSAPASAPTWTSWRRFDNRRSSSGTAPSMRELIRCMLGSHGARRHTGTRRPRDQGPRRRDGCARASTAIACTSSESAGSGRCMPASVRRRRAGC